MSLYFHYMPLDNSTIKTRLRVRPDLFASTKAHIQMHCPQFWTIKPIRRSRSGRHTWKHTFDILTNNGIEVSLVYVNGEPLSRVTIKFNPGVCLYGHNGRMLHLNDFLAALSVLVVHLTPLLSDPADWVDLVPGLRQGSPAYWSCLEVPFQCSDPNGERFAQLRHFRHPPIGMQCHLKADSIEFGSRRDSVQLSIFRKDLEMVKRGNLDVARLSDASGTLRLQTRLSNSMLPRYFGNGRNVAMIDGKERLVWFLPQDLVRGHRECFKLWGGYRLDRDTDKMGKYPNQEDLAQILAKIADDPAAAQTFRELLFLAKFNSGASSDTIRKVGDTGLAEQSLRSALSLGDLFSDADYETPTGVASEICEEKIQYVYDSLDTAPHPLITKAYCPPGQPFSPHVESLNCERIEDPREELWIGEYL
jgi:hypothetical protein